MAQSAVAWESKGIRTLARTRGKRKGFSEPKSREWLARTILISAVVSRTVEELERDGSMRFPYGVVKLKTVFGLIPLSKNVLICHIPINEERLFP